MLTGALPCYRVYATADGRAMALGALEPKFFSAFCSAAGVEHLDGRGLSPDKEIVAELEALFVSRTQEQWVACLDDVDCCCEPVQTVHEALADPGVAIPTVQVQGVTSIATHVGIEARAARREVSALGQDTAAILEDLSVDRELIAEAMQSGALPHSESR